jgi:hypothetical protein
MPEAFTYHLTPSPSIIQTKNGTETRTALRALDCAALDEGRIVPFRHAKQD